VNDAIDEPIRRLLETIAGPAAQPVIDLTAIGRTLAAFAADTDYVGGWVARLGDRSGAVPIHRPPRGPRLTLVHRLAGQMSAVHDHGTWVAISPVHGVETHRRWRVRRDDEVGSPQIEIAEDVALSPSEIATLLPPDDVHDHGHLVGRGDPAYVLILLGDDQTRFTRNEWDPATGRHRILQPGNPGRWIATEPMPGA
jgi:predicted metal-dependent enzyme (double-stranded beta helix superfamily)